MKMWLQRAWPWMAAFLPALFSVILVTFLVEFRVIEFRFSIHDVDTLLIFSGMMLTIVFASILISREGIRRMQAFDMQRAREEAAAEHGRFLRRLDHELKNPLMGIKVAVENLATTDDCATRRHISGDIQGQIEHLSQLVLGLRKLADTGIQSLEMNAVNISEVLREAFLAAQDLPGADEHVFTLDLPDTFSLVRGDTDLLLHAVYNLLTNAVKFTPSGGKISLRACEEDNMLRIEVTDTGIGISTDDLPLVWEELYRAEKAKGIAGSGIGLALVKLVVERHNGSTSITSQPGLGTTVTLHLPLVDAGSENRLSA